jgi:hypothetical protein
MRRISLLLLALAFAFMLVSSATLQRIPPAAEFSDEWLVDSTRAVDLYNELLASFEKKQYTRFDNAGGTFSGFHAADFPMWYAGAYVGRDGVLVVMITRGHEDEPAAQEIISSQDLRVKYAKYSFRQLLETMNDLRK